MTTKKKIHCISNKFRSHNCTCLYTTYLQVVQETVRQSVCAPGAGLNSSEVVSPCVLPLLYCLATSVVRSLSTGCPLRARRGPRGLPPPRIFMFLGGMKAAFVLSPSPGPWRAPRLDSADVDSRVWLISTWTYIAFAVPFMV